MQTTEYDVQAQTWVTKWGVEMVAVFTGHRKHFSGDTDTRDTYSVTLKRGSRSMTFDYGASLNDSKIRPESSGPFWTKVRSNPNPVNLSNPYNPAKQPHGVAKPPSLYFVLACLAKYDTGTFEEWCGDIGYDPNSRKALETYLVVQKQVRDFHALCGPDAEMLREAQEIQ